MLEKISDTVKDEEISQSIARVVIVGVLVLVFAGVVIYDSESRMGFFVSSAYFLYSVLWICLVKCYPGACPSRRYISIVADLGVLSFAMHVMGDYGAALYPVYLWVIVGNGMRFGQRFLLVSMAVGLSGFVALLYYTEFWRSNLPMGIGLLAGLAILPLFYLVLINRLHREIQKSHYAATHDAMTGLVNRAYFLVRLEEEMLRARRYGHQFSLFYIDLDDFKQVNDLQGHSKGDEVLVTTAQRLRKFVRNTDIAARLGGDEFALLVLSISKQKDVDNFSMRLVKALSVPVIIDQRENILSASIGVSHFPDHGCSVNALINAADSAMYHSKKTGKNNYSVCISDSAA